MKPIKYPKTGQFRNLIADINREVSFKGLDENGEPIYGNNAEKPVIAFRGTVKLHGTNASICYSPKDGISTQSKNNRFPDDDKHLDSHFGFTMFVLKSHREFYISLMKDVYEKLNLEDETLVVYGEWAGTGIQKGVAISELPKAFYVFGVKVKPKTGDSKWVQFWENYIPNNEEHGLFNLGYMWDKYIEIDLNNPAKVQNELIKITEEVEKQCPIAYLRSNGEISGVGEGVVWECFFNGNRHIFKVKGKKHSVSKVKTLAEVDPIKIQAVEEFVDYAVTPNRVKQGIQEANPELDIKKTGDFLRWMANDIMSEEADVLLKNNLEWKDVAKYVSTRARQMMFDNFKL